MRIGLSQRGWNNVLIFSSLFMIILFNVTHQKLIANGETEAQTTLIEPNNIIQTIDYNGVKLERIGASWRVVSEINAESISAAHYAQAWRTIRVTPIKTVPQLNTVTINFPVSIYTTGSNDTIVFEILANSEQVFIQNKLTQQWFQLTTYDELLTLVPESLLVL